MGKIVLYINGKMESYMTNHKILAKTEWQGEDGKPRGMYAEIDAESGNVTAFAYAGYAGDFRKQLMSKYKLKGGKS